jgi:PTS hybrid protein
MVAGNGHVRIVLVSHSRDVARGLAELVRQVAGPEVAVAAIGGAADGSLGTDGMVVLTGLRQAAASIGGVVLMDLSSTVLAVRAAFADLSADEQARIRIVDAPLVEGGIAAGVAASTGASIAEVARAAENARHIAKL